MQASGLAGLVRIVACENLLLTFGRRNPGVMIGTDDIEFVYGEAVPRGVLGLLLGPFSGDSPLLNLARAIVGSLTAAAGAGSCLGIGGGITVRNVTGISSGRAK